MRLWCVETISTLTGARKLVIFQHYEVAAIYRLKQYADKDLAVYLWEL